MPTYVLLIRGINVGGNKRLAMADLRELLTGLGYADVRTHLQSGNALFRTAKTKHDAIATQIERTIAADLGLTVRCMTRTAAEMHAVIEANPFAEFASQGSRLFAMFLSANPDASRLAEHDPRELDREGVRLGERVIYQWCPNGLLEAPNVGSFVEKNLKIAVTARNWNTVTRLGAMLSGS